MDIFEVGIRIREIRKMRRMTQEQLAEKTKLTSHYVYEIEHGIKTMSIYTLANIAQALDAPLDYIVFGKRPETDSISRDFQIKDDLDHIVETIPLEKRNTAGKILKVILPHIK